MANIKQTVDLTQGTLSNLIVEDGKLKLPNVNAPTFTRDSIAYKSDGSQVAVNVPRFEQGKFGQAVMVEEGTTNAIPHSSDGKFVYTNVWDRNGYTNDIVEWITDSSVPSPALHVKRITPYPANGGSAYVTFENLLVGSVVPGQKYTISLWFKGNKQSSSIVARIRIVFHDSNNQLIGKTVTLPISFTDNWQRYVFTVTAPDGAYKIQYFQVGLETINLNDTYEFYIAGLQLEQKEYATSWTDGTRAAETLTIPTAGVLNPQEGTVEFWVYVNDIIKRQLGGSANGIVIHIPRLGGSSGIYLFHRGDSPVWEFRTHADDNTYTSKAVSNSYTPNGWHFFALRWSLDRADLFIDGVLRGTISNPKLPSGFYDIAYVGYGGGGGFYSNTLIDDLRISSRARTDEEIAAAYASGQPLPVDEWTTYLLRFSGALNFGRGGYYISPQYDLSTVGSYVKHRVYWQEDADQGECLVYAKLDNQSDWTQLTNGGSLPIVEGQDLTGRKIQFKVKLLDLV